MLLLAKNVLPTEVSKLDVKSVSRISVNYQ